jgi:hypothetical protein
VDVLAGVGLYGLFNKRQEVRPIAGRCALPVDLAGGDVQGGEEVCGAVSDVVVGRFLGRVEGDRQQRLRPVQRLDLRLSVQTEHHCPTRRVVRGRSASGRCTRRGRCVRSNGRPASRFAHLLFQRKRYWLEDGGWRGGRQLASRV